MQVTKISLWITPGSKQWFAKLSATLLAYGFVRSYADYSLFTYCKGKVFLALLVYVGDIILVSNESHAWNELKAYLTDCSVSST